LGYNVFSVYGDTELKSLYLPNTLINVKSNTFNDCSSLENVILENNFNCNNLDLSISTLYTIDTIVSWLNALKDRTDESETYTLIIGSTNLAKLTDEQVAIATSKNWTII
jgi:hypothetical protein